MAEIFENYLTQRSRLPSNTQKSLIPPKTIDYVNKIRPLKERTETQNPQRRFYNSNQLGHISRQCKEPPNQRKEFCNYCENYGNHFNNCEHRFRDENYQNNSHNNRNHRWRSYNPNSKKDTNERNFNHNNPNQFWSVNGRDTDQSKTKEPSKINIEKIHGFNRKDQ